MKLNKDAIRPGMMLTGGSGGPVTHVAKPPPTLAQLQQASRCLGQLETIVKNTLKQVRFNKRWAEIERDLDWSY